MTADQLAEEVAQSAWRNVKVKVGRTNGEPVIHINDLEGRESWTIRNLGEWLVHPLNIRNRPTRREREKEVDHGN